MKKLIHWLSHKLGWNAGEVVVFWEGHNLKVGFKCLTCRKIGGVHDAYTKENDPFL